MSSPLLRYQLHPLFALIVLAAAVSLPLPAAPIKAAGYTASAGGASATARPEIQSYEIVYRVVVDRQNGPGNVHVWFAVRDRWRVETENSNQSEVATAAGDSIVIYDRKRKAALWQVRDERIMPCSPYSSDLSIDFTRSEKTWSQIWAERKHDLTRYGQERLRDSPVVGRACYVYELAASAPSGAAVLGSAKMLHWIDRQLLVPLRVADYRGGKLRLKLQATSVKVNPPVADAIFRLTPPSGASVFKGAISEVPNPDMLKGPGSPTSTDFMPGPPRRGALIQFYQPDYVPQGLKLLSVSYSDAGDWYQVEFASLSGATLVMQSRRGDALILGKAQPLLKDARDVTFDGRQGKIAQRTRPFDRLILVWSFGNDHLCLDATGVSEPELLRMAASVRKREFPPSGKQTAADLIETQAKLHFLVLVPKVLPGGAYLAHVDLTPYERLRNGWQPEQVFISYFTRDGHDFSMLEMRQEKDTAPKGAERVAIGRYTGWYRRNREVPYHEVEWVQEGTRVALSGDLSKKTLLSVAASFAPADPLARDRIREYERRHPDTFGMAWP